MTGTLFGTDGIRAVAGEEPLTPGTVARLAFSFGELLRAKHTSAGADKRPFALVGHDGRASADFLVAAVEAGLAAAGVDFQETGLVTTPGLSTLVREMEAAGGAMLSASHNPAHDNGIKLFGRGGEKLGDADEAEIERRVVATPQKSGHGHREFGQHRLGSLIRPEIYLGGLIERAGIAEGALRGRKVAFDGAHGGGSELGPELLRSLGAEVVEIGTAPNGKNINDGVGALHPETLAKAVLEHGCCFGVALDGDGDRSMCVDERGHILDGDGVIAACAPDLKHRGRLPGQAVVVSVMSNLGLAARLREQGIATDVVPVGDRHLVARLKEKGYALGAEPSGHVIFGSENHYIGDGLFTALRILELLQRTGKPFSELAAFPRFEQVLLNVRIVRRDPLETVAPIEEARRSAAEALGDRGRIVLRYSGTEPLCRVMVEAADKPTAQRHADAIADAVRRTLA